jgi:hypothetical protein
MGGASRRQLSTSPVAVPKRAGEGSALPARFLCRRRTGSLPLAFPRAPLRCGGEAAFASHFSKATRCRSRVAAPPSKPTVTNLAWSSSVVRRATAGSTARSGWVSIPRAVALRATTRAEQIRAHRGRDCLSTGWIPTPIAPRPKGAKRAPEGSEARARRERSARPKGAKRAPEGSEARARRASYDARLTRRPLSSSRNFAVVSMLFSSDSMTRFSSPSFSKRSTS